LRKSQIFALTYANRFQLLEISIYPAHLMCERA